MQALPTTVGHKCAIWLSEVSRHFERMQSHEARVFVGQLELVYEASMRGIHHGVTFEQALMENRQVREALGEQKLRAALDPTIYVGLAPTIVDNVLAEVNASGWLQ